MSILQMIPENLLNFAGTLAGVQIADQREEELLIAFAPGCEIPEPMSKFFEAVKNSEITIDGKKAKVRSTAYFNNPILYLDWSGKGNEAQIAPELNIEHWDAVKDGMHNSNSFLTYWRDEFWLIHASSPYHFATPECKLVLWRSKDAKSWTRVTALNVPNEDIRDPKFAVIGDRLFIYVLKSLVEDGSEPYTTAVTYTDDGENFAPLEELFNVQGWLLWNPRTFDSKTWYAPAYWGGHGNSIILKTTDGLNFEPVSFIHRGKFNGQNDMNDETDFAFFEDGRLLSVQRLEYRHGMNSDPRCCTNITIAQPPYTEWKELGKDYTTRLDGPSMFTYNNRIYCVGRANPPVDPKGPHNSGGVLTRKRTALYEVTEKGLVYLSDFPSSGDTAYGGCVLKDGCLYACYYTSDITCDWPWIVGMLSPSDIRMVKIELARIETLANLRQKEYEEKGLYKFVPAETEK